nr:uncharacterized protein LOC124222327 [Neodiprion pinetum]
MSLLSVTVKKARFVGVQAQQFNTYVTLKLQNVKSTTVTVKGANPCWEQDFLFETNDPNTGLLVEVWSKGMIWDRALGYHYIPLPEVSYSNEVDDRQDGSGQWISLDSELEMRGGEVVGTKAPTGHMLLIDCRFELPFGKCDPPTGWKSLLRSETAMKLRAARPTCGSDPENTEAADLQRKLELLNNIMGQEARAEQARRQILYTGHSGYSEDSDYTSDLNYPVGGQGANSSASQFRTAANQLATPQRSLETSRENSYERDDHQIPATVGGRLTAGSYGGYGGRGHSPRYDEPYPEEGRSGRYTTSHVGESSEPLFYNSRPRHYKESRRRKHTWDQDDSQDGWYSEGYQDYHGTRTKGEGSIFSELDFLTSTTTTNTASKKRDALYSGSQRRPSLERQTTLYDEHSHYPQDSYLNNQHPDATTDARTRKLSATYPESFTDISYNEYYDPVTGYAYQDERYGQDEEDRQWDSGGKWYPHGSTPYENLRNRRKNLPQRPASSIGIHRPEYRPAVTRQRSYDSEEMDYSGPTSRRRKTLQPQRRPMSRQEGTGKKLPPTPTKPSSILVGKKPASLPTTPGRQLPRTRTPSEEGYYKSDYNEDYNYAYQSQDNLPQDTYTENVYGEVYLGLKDSSYQQPYTQTYTTDYSAEAYNDAAVQDQGIYNQAIGQYPKEYDQSRLQDGPYEEPTYNAQQAYEQSKVVGFQEPYQDPYDQTTHDNYGKAVLDPYQTSQGRTNDEYVEPGVVENAMDSTSYKDTGYQQTPDNYQEQYPGHYDSQYNVPASVNYEQTSLAQGNYQDSFDQNNVTEAYDPAIYQKPYDQPTEENYQDKYADQYVVPTSGAYGDGYQEDFGREPVPVSQAQYDESYKQQDMYQDQYTAYKEAYVNEGQGDYKDDYQHQYQDQDYTEQYDDSYQESYQESFEKYKEGEMADIERRQSEVPELSVTTPRGQTRLNGYPSSESEYFYPSQDNQVISPLGLSRKKKLGKREANPLQQQNTDSLESRDDELKESFETAVSSIASSQTRRGFSEYSTAGESSPTAATLVDSPQGQRQGQISVSGLTSANHVVVGSQANVAVVTTSAVVHNGSAITTNGKRLTRTDSYQTEIMEDEYQDVVPSEPRRKDSQLSHQSISSQPSVHSQQKPKLTRGEPYATDHMSRDDSYDNLSRKDSYAQSVRRDSYGSIHTQDGFKPPLNRTDSYQQRELSRGGSYAQNFNAPQPISRAESYQRGYFKQQDSMEDTDIVLSNTVNGEYKMRDETLERYQRGEEAMIRGSRENSLVEPYKGTPPTSHSISPQGSVIKQASLDESVQMDTPPRSPPEPPADEELLDLVGSVPVPTQLKERTEMTPKQRWHWAYNKIIMQLNVSNYDSYLFALQRFIFTSGG